MSEDEIIKYIKNEIEIDIDTRNSFKDNKESPVYKDLDECIKAHQGLLDLYKKEKEKNKELEEKCKEVVCIPEGTCFMMKPKNVVSKDKIKAKIEEVKRKREEEWETAGISMLGSAIDVLIELLEEE